MRRHVRCLWRLLALVPMLGVYNVASCQADVLRRTASELDDRADDLDHDDDLELGDLLSDAVEDW